MAIIDVVKWEVNDKELVYKFPSEQIRLGSQLVVYPGQTALFVKGGKIYDEFICGTYTIKSENIPLLDKVINLPFGGNSPFQAEVWFINQISMLDCKWGTVAPLQIEDPKYEVIVPLRAFGQYGFKIGNPRVFLERLVGNMSSFATNKVIDYFRGVILSKLTAIVYDKLKQDNMSVLNINSEVDRLSDYAKECLSDDFQEYGISMETFNIISISVKEDDPSFQRLKEAKDEAAKIKIIGRENYQMSRSFDVLEKAAENEGDGTMGAAIGLGAGVGIGSHVGAMAAQTLNTHTLNPDSIPPIPTVDYYLAIQGKREGPFKAEQVEQKYGRSEITENTLIWKKGMKAWAKIADIDDFTHLFDENCPPPLPL
ncbi:SPFH domain-containing protein [Phocaeicola barnesiae]|uniref:SPFH domain-containing protein n=1 Tax=Phocaeicola barnesiae TaxID=376804 RepID=UPI001F1F7821|nr:SPFH domain-containing protein [Phocaeicola barnesiae]MCF2599334.1 SPFH domain-containing protein [Phocaeicola barnesiae]